MYQELTMIDDHQIGWLKEFIYDRCLTEDDRVHAKEIIDTFRALWKVLGIAKAMIRKPPAQYSPNSRKGQLQDALAVFDKLGPTRNMEARHD